MDGRTRLRGYPKTLLLAALVLAAVSLAEARRPAAAEAPWGAPLRAVDEALARNDAAAALRAWQDAHLAALGSWRWERMIEVGDAALRIGEVSGLRPAAKARARQAYLTAFFRARDQGSLAGVLRSAEAFALLGDREVVAQCLIAADGLAARAADPEGRERLRSFAALWTSTAWAAETPAAP